MKRFNSINGNYKRIITYLILILGALAMVMPFLWMLSTSLKTRPNVFLYPPQWIPHPARIRNYYDAMESFPFFRYFFNTMFIAITIAIGTVAICSLAGYAFARMKFFGCNYLFLIVLAVMMVPGQVTMIPTFLLVKNLGWIDSYKSLIIPSLASPFFIFLMRQFYLSLPRELEEAAYIDGCNPLRTFYSIFLPNSTPAFVSTGILSILGSWNSFIWPLILISTKEKQVLTVGLLTFQNQYATKFELLMAASVLSMLPVFIAYVFGQRYFIEGISTSGIKV